MLVPVTWLRELVSLPESVTARDIAEAITKRGLEVEAVNESGADLQGPLKVGRVRSIEELTEYKKPIRWVSLDLDEPETRWVICGASNFAVDDLVIVAIPGAVLPGGFAITARETYGKTSNGMICSSRELGLSDDHSGIIVLPDGSAQPGDDAIELLQIRESVIDVAVTPDRGYALSMRGIAREVAIAFGANFQDPVALAPTLALGNGPRAVVIDDAVADRIVVRTVDGFDPRAKTPLWMQRRLEQCGMRSISLLVDITNYVMLELGQPLHAFDDAKLDGSIHVRSARPDELLETLDHVQRKLAITDGVIADDKRALALAGVMGGLESEIDETSTRTTIEAAHFDAVRIAKTSRRHRLSSEASRRFERGVDPELAHQASARAVQFLTDIAGGVYLGGNEVDHRGSRTSIDFDFELPSRLVGHHYERAAVVTRLTQIGCQISGTRVTPPTWRPDLTMSEDLVEEVARLEGYEHIPSVLPLATGGRGLSQRQKLRHRIGMILAARGGIEVLSYPFASEEFFASAGFDTHAAVRLANPISEEEPYLRTTLLSGLLVTAQRNIARGFRTLSLFEVGQVFLANSDSPAAPKVGVSRRPSDQELSSLNAAIPEQPLHAAGLFLGTSSTWWGSQDSADWRTAIANAEAALAGLNVTRRPTERLPWHPGRCAELLVGEQSVGFAGELHPRLCSAWGLPAHSAYFEIGLDQLPVELSTAQTISTMVPAIEDIALVVPADQPAEALRTTIAGAHDLIESVSLFDRYDLGDGKISLAFTIIMRASDRTLTGDELAEIRAAILKSAASMGAALRS